MAKIFMEKYVLVHTFLTTPKPTLHLSEFVFDFQETLCQQLSTWFKGYVTFWAETWHPFFFLLSLPFGYADMAKEMTFAATLNNT